MLLRDYCSAKYDVFTFWLSGRRTWSSPFSQPVAFLMNGASAEIEWNTFELFSGKGWHGLERIGHCSRGHIATFQCQLPKAVLSMQLYVLAKINVTAIEHNAWTTIKGMPWACAHCSLSMSACSICDAVFIWFAEGAVRNAWPHNIMWWNQGTADQHIINKQSSIHPSKHESEIVKWSFKIILKSWNVVN